MQEESKATQLRISREIVQLSISTTIIVASLEQVSNSTARASALSCAVTQPAFSDSQLVTFDLSNSVARDRQIIREASRLNGGQFPHYRHMNSRHEPLLWLPDIVAWCYGRGGPWRDAVEPLVDEVIEI